MNIFNNLEKKVKVKIKELLANKVSEKHIEEEAIRHHATAVKACEYIGLLLLAVTIYFLGEGKFYFLQFFECMFLLYISHWMPDFFFLFSNLICRKKVYLPSHKRKFSHSSIGLIAWTCIASVFSFFLMQDIFWWIVATSLAFTGYWIHLATDKVELFIDKVAEFVEKSFKEK